MTKGLVGKEFELNQKRKEGLGGGGITLLLFTEESESLIIKNYE